MNLDLLLPGAEHDARDAQRLLTRRSFSGPVRWYQPATGTLYWVPTSPEPQRPPTGLLRTSAKSMELTKEGERMAQEGNQPPKTIGPTAGQRSAKREGPKSGPRRTMQQPETLIFTRLARWPGPSCGPAGQGRFGAGPALTGGMYAPVGPASPRRASKPNHRGQSLPSAPHKGQGTGRHQTGSRRSCRANMRRGA